MSVQSLSQGFSLSGLPILDFDPNDPIGFEIWLKKWRSWIYLSNLESKQTMYHSLIKCFTDKTMKVNKNSYFVKRTFHEVQLHLAWVKHSFGTL
jgi:hypothetical protein